MNKVELIGRLTKKPEINEYGKGKNKTKVARYTLAVDRVKSEETDFISCTVFGDGCDFVEKYLDKGMKIAVCGSIRTGSYENKEGETVYTTNVVVTEHYFCEKKKDK